MLLTQREDLTIIAIVPVGGWAEGGFALFNTGASNSLINELESALSESARNERVARLRTGIKAVH